jgi:hypothetical protein
MNALIAMPGPWLPEGSGDFRQAHTELPARQGLTWLLRRARRLPDATDWRGGAWSMLGGAELPPVAVAACAVPEVSPQASLCMVAPLHVVAGISRVHLPPGGRLWLEPGEEQAWRAAFNQEFGASGIRLHCAAPGGGWLLEAPFAAAARDAEPESLVGEALQRQPATSAAERALRRFGAEVEMWLAAHELNREREARRVPPVNSVWLWGGGMAAPLPPPTGSYLIVGNAAPDAWLCGLASWLGAQAEREGQWTAALRRVAPVPAQSDPRTLLIVLSPDAGGASAGYWQMLERDWFAPLAASVQRGEVPRLRLQIGRSAWQLPSRSLLRGLVWRRRSWWQMTGEPRP